MIHVVKLLYLKWECLDFNEKVTLHTRCDYFEKDECKNAIDIEYDEY